MAFGFLKKVVKVAGAPVKLSLKVAIAPTKIVGKAVGHIPVVGKPLKSAINLGNAPLNLLNKIAEGERIDHAVINNIRQQAKNVHDIAPYAKMVVSLVPGVGTGIAAGIAAGCALAEGQPLSEAIVAGIKGAVPGGALAQSVFNISGSVLAGKPLQANLIAAIPLDAKQKAALTLVVNSAKDVAAGKSINKIATEQAQNLLPPDVRKAVNIGIAVGNAQTQQKKQVKSFDTSQLSKLYTEGMAAIKANAVLQSGYNALKTAEDKKGFAIGTGLMHHTATATEIATIQAHITKAQSTGFNIALAAKVGMSTINPPVRTTPAQKFGIAMAHGLEGASLELKTDAIKTIAVDAQIKDGIISVAQKKAGWLHKLLVAIHLIHEEKAA